MEPEQTNEAPAAPEDEIVKGRIATHGAIVNDHHVGHGEVVSMKKSMRDLHRDHGVAIEDVEDDYDGDVKDISEPPKPEDADERVAPDDQHDPDADITDDDPPAPIPKRKR
jgi:hypothetical protein